MCNDSFPRITSSRRPRIARFRAGGGWHWGNTVPRVRGSGFKLIAFSKRAFLAEDAARTDGNQALAGLPDNHPPRPRLYPNLPGDRNRSRARPTPLRRDTMKCQPGRTLALPLFRSPAMQKRRLAPQRSIRYHAIHTASRVDPPRSVTVTCLPPRPLGYYPRLPVQIPPQLGRIFGIQPRNRPVHPARTERMRGLSLRYLLR